MCVSFFLRSPHDATNESESYQLAVAVAVAVPNDVFTPTTFSVAISSHFFLQLFALFLLSLDWRFSNWSCKET